jgi:undecaprenyl-diphosphatase
MTMRQMTQAVHIHFRKQNALMRLLARRGRPSYVDRFGPALFMLAVALPLLVFLLIADRIHDGGAFAFEDSLLLSLHEVSAPILDHIALVMSMLVTVIGVTVLCCLLARRLWRTALFWFIAVAGAAVLNSIVKKAIQRDRPALWDLVVPHASFGFPSGHAMQSMAVAIGLAVLFRFSKSRVAIASVGVGFVTVIATCRMYLGLHYPTDVLAGWMLSLAWVSALAMLFDERYLTLQVPRRNPAANKKRFAVTR